MIIWAKNETKYISHRELQMNILILKHNLCISCILRKLLKGPKSNQGGQRPIPFSVILRVRIIFRSGAFVLP